MEQEKKEEIKDDVKTSEGIENEGEGPRTRQENVY